MVPGTSGGDDGGIGTDPLSELLSWDEPGRPHLEAPGAGEVDATSQGRSETDEPAGTLIPESGSDPGNDEASDEYVGTSADQEGEATPATADPGPAAPVFGAPLFGQSGYGSAGYGPAAGQQAWGRSSRLPSGYPPAPYGQPTWPGPWP